MENYNTKDYSTSKRKRRHSDPRETRKSNNNGHTLRKIFYGNVGERNNNVISIEKKIGDFKKNDENKNVSLNVETPFEKELGIRMFPNLKYSINKHKNWEKLDSTIANCDKDEMWIVPNGKSNNNLFKENFERETNRTYLAYFNELDNDMLQKQRRRRSGIEMNELEDEFYHTNSTQQTKKMKIKMKNNRKSMNDNDNNNNSNNNINTINGVQMTNQNIPSCIIAIRQSNQNYNRNHYGFKRFHGVVSYSHSCRREDAAAKKKQRQKIQLKMDSKRLMQYGDDNYH